jgi:hypothetical protein
MSMVQQAIEVTAPLHTVYEQIAAFENYPRFMSGVREVSTFGTDQTHWIMEVDGKRREFDAQITERSLDERVSWSTMEGPLVAETITLRPLGETKTQVVAQLEADIAFLMPSDRHGQASLIKRLKDDLANFKGMVESGKAAWGRPSPKRPPAGASSKLLSGGANPPYPGGANPAWVAARIRNRNAHPVAAGWEAGAAGPVGGGVAGTAQMGGRTTNKDAWGDGMINEEDRGSAHDM